MSAIHSAGPAQATSPRRSNASADAGRSWLRLVPPMPFAPPRAPFVILVIGLIGAGLVGLLLVNTSMQQGAFEVSRLQRTNAALAEQQGQLERTAGRLESPVVVTSKAAALGMVPDPNPVFLRLSDGKILGKPVPATAPPAPPKKTSTTKTSTTKTSTTKTSTTKTSTTKTSTTKTTNAGAAKKTDTKKKADTDKKADTTRTSNGGDR